MPRYPLIMKHEVYFALYERAGKEHTSLGKLINRILEAEVRRWKKEKEKQDTINPHCMTCIHYVLRNKWCPVTQTTRQPNEACNQFNRG